MQFIDARTVISAIASVAGLFASRLEQFSKYRKWLLPFGAFFLGMLVARLLDAIVPPQALFGEAISSRQMAWGVILIVGSLAVLITLIREDSRAALWVVIILVMATSTLRLFLADESAEITFGERLSIVESRERLGDFDGAIRLLTKAKENSENEERTAIDKRITELQSEKLKKISTPASK